MKKRIRRGVYVLATLLLLCGGSVYATDTFINTNGVSMTETQANKIDTIFSEGYSKYISQNEFDKYIDAEIVSSDIKYSKSTYKNGEFVSEEEVTREEFENSTLTSTESESCKESTGNRNYSDTVTTNYKSLNTTVIVQSGNYSMVNVLHWTQVPKYRSYDVFAFYLSNFSYYNVAGSQVYYNTSGSGSYNYNSSSAGYKSSSVGAGISMNLKDGSNITGYYLSLTANLTAGNSSHGTTYVSYQHAKTDLTRAQSMSYTFSLSGLGNVVYYSSPTLMNSYDGMSGTIVYVPF